MSTLLLLYAPIVDRTLATGDSRRSIACSLSAVSICALEGSVCRDVEGADFPYCRHRWDQPALCLQDDVGMGGRPWTAYSPEAAVQRHVTALYFNAIAVCLTWAMGRPVWRTSYPAVRGKAIWSSIRNFSAVPGKPVFVTKGRCRIEPPTLRRSKYDSRSVQYGFSPASLVVLGFHRVHYEDLHAPDALVLLRTAPTKHAGMLE